MAKKKTVTKDLGLVTAYGYAKEGGYTGTEEDFKRALAITPKSVKRIGELDFSSAWTDEGLKTKVGEVGYNTTLSFDFVNHSRKQEIWDNFILIFDDNTYFRPDNYSWGGYTVEVGGKNWDPNTQKEDMDGAFVHAEVINWLGTVRIMFAITTVEGVFRYQWYDLQGTFNNSAYSVALTVDHAYVDLYLDSAKVCETIAFLLDPFHATESLSDLRGAIKPPIRIAYGNSMNGTFVVQTSTQAAYYNIVNGRPFAVSWFGFNQLFIGNPANGAGRIVLSVSDDSGYLDLYGNSAHIRLNDQVLTAEKLQQSNQLVTRVGSADFTTALEAALYNEIQLPYNHEASIWFRNYSDKAENWHNAYARVRLYPDSLGDNTFASLFFRMDDYAFAGAGSDPSIVFSIEKGNDWDWSTFKDDVHGALCELHVDNCYLDNEMKARIEFTVYCTNGKTHHQWYTVTLSDNHIDKASINLTVENSYIDVFNNSLSIPEAHQKNMRLERIVALADPVNAKDAANKDYVDSAISRIGTIIKIKGTKPTINDLPASGNTQGDLWFIAADGSEYVWTGSQWEKLGVTIDLSEYAPINSPAFTGTPTVPTASEGDNSSAVSNTAFVGRAINTSEAKVIAHADRIDSALKTLCSELKTLIPSLVYTSANHNGASVISSAQSLIDAIDSSVQTEDNTNETITTEGE